MRAAERRLAGLAGAGVPLLGICFGHQLIARALGGRVGWDPTGGGVGTLPVTLTRDGREDDLLGPLGSPFPAQFSHRQSVLEPPPEAVILAAGEGRLCPAFRVASHVWGVQFHPEFTPEITRLYLERHRERLEADGRDVDAVRDAVGPSPAGALLAGFARRVAV